MRHYDPDAAVDASQWLALDEQVRIGLAEAHHRAAHVELPNLTAHACFHAIVENQIALGHDPVVRALARLMNEGLSRHDAVHAIGSVVVGFFWEASRSTDKDFGDTVSPRYDAALEGLTAEGWRREHGEGSEADVADAVKRFPADLGTYWRRYLKMRGQGRKRSRSTC